MKLHNLMVLHKYYTMNNEKLDVTGFWCWKFMSSWDVNNKSMVNFNQIEKRLKPYEHWVLSVFCLY